jgi:hypothetical protein
MEFRWMAIIALWVILVGPVMNRPGLSGSCKVGPLQVHRSHPPPCGRPSAARILRILKILPPKPLEMM